MSVVAAPSYGTAELRAGDSRVVIAPGLGGKIVSMQLAGHEWLWSDPKRPHRLAGDGEASGSIEGSGGFDECFPTAAECSLPVIAGKYTTLHLPNAYSGLSFPEGGELWSQPCTFALETRDEGVYATCGWVGERMPYRFARALYVSGEGSVTMRYGVSNDGLDRLPYLWCSQPFFPLTKNTRIEMPDGARVRVWRQHGVELGGVGAENRWPRVAAGGKLIDLSRPDAIARRFACRLFVDLPHGEASIIEDDARLDVAFESAHAPCISLWINRQGWSSRPKRKAATHLSLGPASGAPESLTEALSTWKGAQWLEPGETKEWTVVWSGARG